MDVDIAVSPYDVHSNNPFLSLESGSIRRSRFPQNTNESEFHNQNYSIEKSLQWCASSTGNQTTLEVFLDILKWSGLQGPVILLGDKQYLGDGSQFAVYKQTMAGPDSQGYTCWDVATKQPKVPQDANIKLSHANPEVEKHLHHLFLELLALTHTDLRNHPNIASLIAWSYDAHAFHSPLILVMALADYNLAAYLKAGGVEVSLASKYCICQDIAAGLDALHGCKLVHGDLKPENVLLYKQRGRLLAKLADFGLLVSEPVSKPTDLRLGGTLGWQAPEVEEGRILNLDELPRTDSYSLGLVIWSSLLYGGKAPPKQEGVTRQALAMKDIETSRHDIGLKYDSCLPGIISELLQENQKRPKDLEKLFEVATSSEEHCHSRDLFKDASDGSEEDEDTEEITYEFAWELPPLNANFLSDLYSLFKRDSNSLPRALLFALYQSLLRYPKDSNAALEVLIASASLGYEPAGEAVPATYQLLGMEIPVDISGKVLKWLERAVATGSVLAKPYLEQSNLESLTCSLTAFQNSGGYNTYYSFVNPSERHSGSERNTEYSKLHWLAAYGSAAALVEYLSNEHNFHINEMTEDEETPLYLAAARGSWEHAKVLLSHGACPSIKCTPFEISCMHWLFAFEKTTQRVAATEFIRYGAELDALASYEVPFYHYPFVLPSGSPLHWAVATSSHQTVQVLLQLGANALLRDGSDPYVYDDPFGSRIHKLGGPNLDIYSVSETPTLGLSPLDLAAMQHDPSIFEVMLSMKKLIDINASDEEGFSVLHRLGTKREGRTRLEQPFRFLSFRPYLNTPYKALEYTIEKIISLGGDLNKLTTPTETEARQSLSADSMEQHRTFTPLMLALHNHACDVVQALLALGASVVVENTLGETVLHHLPSGVMGEKPNEELLGSVKLLVSHGADIHHRSKIGVEPVLKAATSISLDVMDFFLSIGANIDARVQSKNAVDVGSNIFFFLAHEHCITIDVKVANMLEKYVFSSSDAEKRRNVIEVGDIEGLTLLHAFARALMPSCVKTLLKHGAPVNALHKRSTEKGRVRSTWYNTPLDTVLAEKATKEKRMAETRHLSLKEYTHMCQMADNMIAILENAGGISNRQKVMETPSASSERM